MDFIILSRHAEKLYFGMPTNRVEHHKWHLT